MSLIKTLLRGAGIVLVSMLASKLLAYTFRAAIAKYLGVEQYGIITTGLALLILFVMASNFGMTTGVVRFVSFYKGQNDPDGIKRTIYSAVKVTLLIGIPAAIALFLLAGPLATFVFHNEILKNVIILFAFLVPVIAVTNLLTSALRAYGLIGRSVFVTNIALTGLQVALLGIMLFFGYKTFGAAVAYAGAAILAAALATYFVIKYIIRAVGKSQQPTQQSTKELVSYSAPLFFAFMTANNDSNLATLIVGFFLGVTGAGLFGAVLPTAALIGMVSVVLMPLFAPLITELYAKKQEQQIAENYKIIVRWILAAGLPVAMFMTLFPKQILFVFFGHGFEVAATALMLLAWAQLLRAVMRAPLDILTAYAKTKTILAASVSGAVISGVGTLLLTPVFGVTGAGISFLIASVFTASYMFVAASRVTKVSLFDRSYVSIIAALGVATSVFYFLNAAELSLFVLAGLSLVYLLVYVGLVFLLKGFTAHDIEILKSSISFMRRRLLKEEPAVQSDSS
jgi:O-antigen/teichoic acid export membrane protein